MKELAIIQSKLKAPKNQYNSFGRYNYRSCEDILEAVKPLLNENNCTLTISDDIVSVGNRIYVKATARLVNANGEEVITTALAREDEAKKGMDASQITGATSSYARKYALNGLFCIDDNKDSDSTNTHESDAHSQNSRQNITEDNAEWLAIETEIKKSAETQEGLTKAFMKHSKGKYATKVTELTAQLAKEHGYKS